MKQARELVQEAGKLVNHIPPQDASDLLEAGEAIIIDVREPTEWERHIPSSLQIPRGLIEFVADPECGPVLPPSLKYEIGPETTVITYCNTGARATLAALTLQTMRHPNVHNLAGGLAAWEEAGLPVSEHHSGI